MGVWGGYEQIDNIAYEHSFGNFGTIEEESSRGFINFGTIRSSLEKMDETCPLDQLVINSWNTMEMDSYIL